MKRWIFLSCCLLVVTWVFGQEGGEIAFSNAKTYELNGRINGEYRGKVYLVREERMHGPQTRIDSCEVTDGCFRFTGEAPEHAVIYFIQSQDGQLAPVFGKRASVDEYACGLFPRCCYQR